MALLWFIVLVVLALGALALWATIYGIVRAARNGDTPWIIGICVGWFFGAGWIVALIYLITQDPARSGPGLRGYGYHAPQPPLPPGSAGGPPAGWHPDPQGRFESRYWDGTRWTEHVSTNGQPTVDPL